MEPSLFNEIKIGDEVEFFSDKQTPNGPVTGEVHNKHSDLLAVKYRNTIEWFILDNLTLKFRKKLANDRNSWGFI